MQLNLNDKIVIGFKKNILILFSFAFFCCQNQEPETKYYPSKKMYINSNLVKINLNTSDLNFKQITIKIYEIYSKGKIPFIEIVDKGVYKKIIPLLFSERKKRNVLTITSDSILSNNWYSIYNLKSIMKRHYSNNGKDFHYPSSYKNAIVEITLDTNKKGKDIIKTLNYLIKTFDEVNLEIKDTLELKIFFDFFRQIPPPPKQNL